MQVIIKPTGVFVGIYNDTFDYGELGKPCIRRASHIEPTDDGCWTADLSPVDGPQLGPFDKRNEAIEAELEYLNLMLNDINYPNDQLVPS